jgi:AcrR family transcriptional regulator
MARQATLPGPRGSDTDTRVDILRVARKSFSENGSRGTTLRDLGPTVQRCLTGNLS